MMNASSSFEISSETLEKSFFSYENDTSQEDIEDCTLSKNVATNVCEVKNPVKKKLMNYPKFKPKKV